MVILPVLEEELFENGKAYSWVEITEKDPLLDEIKKRLYCRMRKTEEMKQFLRN